MTGYDDEQTLSVPPLYPKEDDTWRQCATRTVSEEVREIKRAVRESYRLKRWEEVQTLYDRLPIFEKCRHGSLVKILVACANLGDFPRLERVISSLACEDAGAPAISLTSLLRAYRFVRSIRAELADWLREAILARLNGSSPPLKDLLHFCHRCVEERRWREFEIARVPLRAMCTSVGDLARMNILNSQVAFRLDDFGMQETQINHALERFGLSPISRKREAESVHPGNLMGRTAEARELGGPLVSVLMTTFNRAEKVQSAVESVLNQTWSNLELIVVDDASEDQTFSIILELAASDTRIRPLRLTRNGGTYVAKNHGLLVCRGEFVTCQDSDDWAHPSKIETGVRHLLDNPDAVATTVQRIRINSVNGTKSRIGYPDTDYSSLLFRQAPVIAGVGYYDSVRVGADAEMIHRIVHRFGDGAVAGIPKLLSFMDWGEGTLTGSGVFAMDEEQGVFSPHRLAYRLASRRWLELDGEKFIPFPLLTRPFEVQ